MLTMEQRTATKETLGVREYTFLPDGWSEDYEHPQALIVRIGQYQKTNDNPLVPPPYFVELETRDLDVYDDVRRVLKEQDSDPKIKKINNEPNGDDDDLSYRVEYQIRESRMAARDLMEFTKAAMTRLSDSGLVSKADTDLLLRQENEIFPSDDDIVRRR